MQITRSKGWWLSKAHSEPESPIGAGVEQQNLCMEYRPTLVERFWHKAGWRYQHQELPDDAPIEGWAMTQVRLNVSFTDRLRLLLTGRVRLDIRQAFNTHVDTVVCATSVEILRPGARF